MADYNYSYHGGDKCPECGKAPCVCEGGKMKYEEKGGRIVKGPRDYRPINAEHRGHYMGERSGGEGKGGVPVKGPYKKPAKGDLGHKGAG